MIRKDTHGSCFFQRGTILNIVHGGSPEKIHVRQVGRMEDQPQSRYTMRLTTY